MNSKAVKIVKNFRAPSKGGTYHRLLSLTGANKGTSYYIEEERVVLGRGESAHVQILDAKASREHAEIVKYMDHYVLTDLGSQNGIVVNDLKINQHRLTDGDKIIVGQTVFKFEKIEVKGGQLEEISSPAKAVSKVSPKKSSSASLSEKEDGDKEKEGKEKPGKKKLVVLLAALFAIFFVLDEEPKKVKKKKERRILKDVSSSYEEMMKKKKQKEDREEQKKIDAIVHRGQREFREKNYFRALEEFQQALILDPSNGQAAFYKRKTKQALDNTIQELFLKARREMDSFRLRGSLVSYCAIIRLLKGYSDDERFLQAERQVRSIEKRLGMFEGEYKCSEE